MRLSAGLPAGVAGLGFEVASRLRELEGSLAGVVEAAGYREMVLPMLDYDAPYEAARDGLARNDRQRYRLIDREGEVLALRSDFTPLLARLLAPRLVGLELPLRIFYRGEVVREERTRFAGLREVHQFGAELVGVAGEAGEREILELFLQALRRAAPEQPASGLRPRAVLGLAGVLDAAIENATSSPSEAGELRAALGRRERAVTRFGRCFGEIAREGVPRRFEDLGEPAASRLAHLAADLERLREDHRALAVSIDLAEFCDTSQGTEAPQQDSAASGIGSFYDGLVFRAYAPGRVRPVAAGGRYDRLFHRLGAATPAVGFSISLDGLLASDAST